MSSCLTQDTFVPCLRRHQKQSRLAVGQRHSRKPPLVVLHRHRLTGERRQRQARSSHFFRHFNVGCIKLSIAVWFQHTEKVTDDLFLPIQKLEVLSRPCALGMAQALNEIHRIIRSLFAILGIISHKSSRFVFCHRFTSLQ